MPILIGPEPAELLGTLSLGFRLSDSLAQELKALAQSEVVLLVGENVVATTVSVQPRQLSEVAGWSEVATLTIDGDDYVASRRPFLPRDDVPANAIIMRSRSARLSFLQTFREGLLVSALFGILLAILLSYVVTRTVTRPLGAITQTMREIADTGDLARKIELRSRWNDEDATVLAATFNRLTDSILRFQRESALRERLSALGRMSTVLAHEIRNLLMIIKASLRSLRRDDLPVGEIREAAEDIDHEVARLNRMVGDVLDFARPIRVDCYPTDVNAVCRRATESVLLDEASFGLTLSLSPSLPEIMTDGERLHAALVNVLVNARDAVAEHREDPSSSSSERRDASPDVEVETTTSGEERVSIFVRDRGVGISPEDLSRIFEPYFTGKRTGTGLGLAITKNSVLAVVVRENVGAIR